MHGRRARRHQGRRSVSRCGQAWPRGCAVQRRRFCARRLGARLHRRRMGICVLAECAFTVPHDQSLFARHAEKRQWLDHQCGVCGGQHQRRTESLCLWRNQSGCDWLDQVRCGRLHHPRRALQCDLPGHGGVAFFARPHRSPSQSQWTNRGAGGSRLRRASTYGACGSRRRNCGTCGVLGER